MNWRRTAWLITAASALGCASKKTTPQAGGGEPERLDSGLHVLELETADGVTRRYDVHVPQRPLGERPPLVVVMHGGGGGAENGRSSTRMDETADGFGFVAVFPQGTPGKRAREKRPLATWHASSDCCGAALEGEVDDVAFIREVVSEVSERVDVDASRVYATGHSNGGLMALRLACEASDVFAAVVAVGAPGSDWSGCDVARPAPVLVVHGAMDRCAPLDGGACGGCFERAFTGMTGVDVEPRTWACPSVRESMEPWIERASVTRPPETIPEEGGAACEVWIGQGGAEVRLCVDPGLGHAWPDGAPVAMCRRRPEGRACNAWMAEVGPRSAAFDNRLQWRFLREHRLPSGERLSP